MNFMAHQDPLVVLLAAMKRKKLNAKQLAEASGVHPSSIWRYLKGKCEVGALNAHRLAPILGVGSEDILGKKYAA
jgi:transcriptional regulator with XRE-family HTH domain